MKGTAIFATLALSLLVMLSCSSPMTKEAEDVAQECFDTMYVECGDSTFDLTMKRRSTGVNEWIFQFKGFAVDARSVRLTPADKENGIEWKGMIVTKCRIVRGWDPRDEDPSTWADCDPTRMEYPIQLRDGQWEIGYPLDCVPTEYTCEDLADYLND